MEYIKNRFYEKASKDLARFQQVRKEYGDVVLGEVTIDQVLSGMKGIPALLTETSKLDANEGIRFQGYSLPELQEKLPKLENDGEPLPEGLFYLMMIGEIPEKEDVLNISKDWATRAHVPQYVFDVIDALPKNSRPMTQFSSAILAMAYDSVLQKAYRAGVNKKFYWDFMYEDVMNLIARLPRIAAYIYRRLYHNGHHIAPNPTLDWAGNLAHMMGFDSVEVKRLLRMYMVIHADHEGGNVSAHATHLVGSALSNAYYSFAAGMTGLAGPLHGFANQEVMIWIEDMIDQIGNDEPSDTQIANYIEQTLAQGRVVPGYGHAVLRITDPRFTVQQQFAEKYIKNDKPLAVPCYTTTELRNQTFTRYCLEFHVLWAYWLHWSSIVYMDSRLNVLRRTHSTGLLKKPTKQKINRAKFIYGLRPENIKTAFEIVYSSNEEQAPNVVFLHIQGERLSKSP